mmetsp:Transcript_11422/g.28900  ORF Transcript_11422/g.28900 Transcript_11422/m.28900 type:complete len:222 (+) Transcript_11422:478-1143(+)
MQTSQRQVFARCGCSYKSDLFLQANQTPRQPMDVMLELHLKSHRLPLVHGIVDGILNFHGRNHRAPHAAEHTPLLRPLLRHRSPASRHKLLIHQLHQLCALRAPHLPPEHNVPRSHIRLHQTLHRDQWEIRRAQYRWRQDVEVGGFRANGLSIGCHEMQIRVHVVMAMPGVQQQLRKASFVWLLERPAILQRSLLGIRLRMQQGRGQVKGDCEPLGPVGAH